MPNPLSVAISSPSNTAKPQGKTPEPGADAGSSFEAVLAQNEGETGDKDAAIAVADPEPEPEIEAIDDTVPEGAETPLDILQVVREPFSNTRFELNTSVAPVDNTTPVTQAEFQVQNAEGADELAQSDVTRSRDALPREPFAPQSGLPIDTLVRSASPETAELPRAAFVASALQISELRPKETKDPSSHSATNRGDTQLMQLPDPVQAQPSVSERAGIAQMQLFATETSRNQSNTIVPEAEDAPLFRADSLVSPGRDTTSAPHFTVPLAKAETARAIAGQMATVITAQPQSGAVEIALNPEELGRVSITLNGRDDGLHLTIAAERPETLDMMRRHLSVLEDEFRNFGLGDLTFDLGNSADTEQNQSDPQGSAPTDKAQLTESATEASLIPKAGLVGRIDMRL